MKKQMKNSLFTVNNPKTIKSKKVGYLEIILHLAPHTISGYNTCSHSNKDCRSLCLVNSGHGGFTPNVMRARIAKTKLFFENNEYFLKRLNLEIYYYQLEAEKQGLKLLVRLNGTSDINWLNYKIDGKTLFEIHKNLTFVDYTKNLNFVSPFENYKIVYSIQRGTLKKGLKLLSEGKTIAGVFTEVPSEYHGKEITIGDHHDAINLHDNKFLGLKYKKLTYKGVDNKEIIKNNKLILDENNRI